jgi:hypothetical protein
MICVVKFKRALIFSMVAVVLSSLSLLASHDDFNQVSRNTEDLLMNFLRHNEKNSLLSEAIEHTRSVMGVPFFQFDAQYDPGYVLFNCLKSGVTSQSILDVINSCDDLCRLRLSLLIAEDCDFLGDFKQSSKSYLNWSKPEHLVAWKSNAKEILSLAAQMGLSETISARYPILENSVFVNWLKQLA